MRRIRYKESNKDEDIKRKREGRMKEEKKMERKEETEKEIGVRFAVTIKFPICTIAPLTGTQIIPSFSQN